MQMDITVLSFFMCFVLSKRKGTKIGTSWQWMYTYLGTSAEAEHVVVATVVIV